MKHLLLMAFGALACATDPAPASDGAWTVRPAFVLGVPPGSSATACIGEDCTAPVVADSSGRATWSGSFDVSDASLRAGMPFSVTGSGPRPICTPRTLRLSADDLRLGRAAVLCDGPAVQIYVSRAAASP